MIIINSNIILYKDFNCYLLMKGQLSEILALLSYAKCNSIGSSSVEANVKDIVHLRYNATNSINK